MQEVQKVYQDFMERVRSKAQVRPGAARRSFPLCLCVRRRAAGKPCTDTFPVHARQRPCAHAGPERARAAGRYLGVGLSSYVEICGVAPSAWIGLPGEGWGAGLWESANVRVHLTGQVVVTTGSLPHGQGLETTFAQLVADELGVAYENVVVEHSDTAGTPFGYGTYGSRSAAVGGTAIVKSTAKISSAISVGSIYYFFVTKHRTFCNRT